MTSGKLAWTFLKAISCMFLFVLFPLVPATSLALGYSNSYVHSYQPPVHSLLGHPGELYKNVNARMLPL